MGKYREIKSLKALKEWNTNPTKEPVIVFDWALDWVFDTLLPKKDYGLFVEAYHTLYEFAHICEPKMTAAEIRERISGNLNYWGNRASKPHKECVLLNRYLTKLGVSDI